MAAPKLVIFDCDGVLVDSEPLANRKLIEHAAALGLQLDPDATLREFNGAALRQRVATLAVRHGWTPPVDFVEQVDAAIDAAVGEAEAIPGVESVLDQLARGDVPVCLASNSRHAEIQLRLEHIGFVGRFLRCFSAAEDVPNSKPAPDIYLYAAQTMNVAPTDCVVIEDSENGIRAAVAAGMQVLGFARFTPAERVHALGATAFSDMSELPALLAGRTDSASA